ncbi:MAG: GNAT family N-acetyltransferase [Chthoniobacterales bacterium]|nr:GNAT family N-acetyltransferase [Chthoniobacterales bacterium]
MIYATEPILPVRDIQRSVSFYRERLGFARDWVFGDPPNHAGVSWGRIQVMFTLNPALAERCTGLQQFFRVEDVQSLFATHRERDLDFVYPLENKPWGLAEYAVRDPDGHHLRFAGAELQEKRHDAPVTLPSYYRIDVRTPSVEDFIRLHEAVDWAKPGDAAILPEALRRTTFCVAATDTRTSKTVAMLRVVGDGKAFTFWDVMVDRPHQGKRIGSEMLKLAIAHLRTLAPSGTFVGLFSQKPAFYERLGFTHSGGLHLPL